MIGASRVLRGLAVVAIAATAAWAAGALWHQAPRPEWARAALLAAGAALAVAACVGAARRRPGWPAAYAAAFAALLGWWTSLEPRLDRDWSPEMARTVTAEIAGDRLTVRDVRNFDWTSLDLPADDGARRWETRTYDLTRLRSVDVISLYWMGPAIGHTYFSFVFEDDEALAFSVEIRKERGEPYSPVAGFFKAYELAIVAGDERDLVGWRTFAPGESLQMFRTNATPAEARALLLAVLDLANALAREARFYDTLTANCTTTVWLLADALGDGLPFDWRVVLSGYLPDYLYDLGRLDGARPLAELRALGELQPRARAALAAGLSGPAFSRALRAGVPHPASP